MSNTLYFGDNLDIMRHYIKDASVDLIYLDPPFNSNRNYNVLFKDESGLEAEAQITAFEDTWHWNDIAEATYRQIIEGDEERAGAMVGALFGFIGRNQMMAYLVMMAVRLLELHRVLKPTGSLYLHCDPTASHYLKLLLDSIFGEENFRNEIVWKRAQPKSHTTKRFSRAHDVILFYSKSPEAVFKHQFKEHDAQYLEQFYKYVEEDTGRRYTLGDLLNPNKNRPNLTYEFPPKSGIIRTWRWTKNRMLKAWEEGRIVVPAKGKMPRYKRYLDEMLGTPITSVWSDIEHLHGSNNETLGYPTQKPVALLERIILSSSNEGDVVLDPFCGCGTTIAAAHKLGRQWIGIDITYLAIALINNRIKDTYPDLKYNLVGIPKDIASARKLAQHDRYQFQYWALSLIGAKPLGWQASTGQGKKGADRGIDGIMNFIGDANAKPQRILVQVKSGGVKSGDVRDLRGTVEREEAAMGIFITLEASTREMRTEAGASGIYRSALWGEFPRIQVVTVQDLLNETGLKLPPRGAQKTFKRSERAKNQEGDIPQELFDADVDD